ncbi:MAG: hypothetical protein LKF75_03255 [Bacilli bacterium]|nr:hypothetical protein [Bacilli bacterium]MCH4228700.1 hypothetical protein [Bacilli bacterium]MCH4278122.1 hypothetical protein [Bacilli bacterium]
MGEQTQTENAERPLDNNAYHVLAMLFAPVVAKAFQDTRKRKEAVINPEGGFPIRLKNGIAIHVEPIEFGKIQMNTQA